MCVLRIGSRDKILHIINTLIIIMISKCSVNSVMGGNYRHIQLFHYGEKLLLYIQMFCYGEKFVIYIYPNVLLWGGIINKSNCFIMGRNYHIQIFHYGNKLLLYPNVPLWGEIIVSHYGEKEQSISNTTLRHHQNDSASRWAV